MAMVVVKNQTNKNLLLEKEPSLSDYGVFLIPVAGLIIAFVMFLQNDLNWRNVLVVSGIVFGSVTFGWVMTAETNHKISWDFDLHNGQLFERKQALLPSKFLKNTYDLTKVILVEVSVKASQSQKEYSVSLCMKDSKKVEIPSLNDAENVKLVGRLLEDILSVPLEYAI